ncbi:ROK family protein [Herbiconiux sp. L3-i23]|uniref:ROK family protein n=1 Tax=Herbiconiux sp. L3-i23 TaxID=2905871 RepID=UPI00204D326B|nr:ROK family protein [Herbiconiux sp. L3-i23]BDI21497.1 sugar kinase [Herbiconiux sp. L3-i23]
MRISAADAAGTGGAPTSLGSNLENVRQHNLSTVLSLVHANGAMSRAQLTRATGLNRSTVADLSAELVGLGLAVESEPVGSQIGRPSPVVEPSRGSVVISVNPDLDAVEIGVIGLGGDVQRRVTYRTTRIPSALEVVNVVSAVVAGMRDDLESAGRIVGVGLAVPGIVRTSDGLVVDAPHLGWVGEPLSTLIGDALGLPVFAANDAQVGASAQWVFGAGRNSAHMAYLYGGASGIGGGLVAEGRLITGTSGFAGQIGHMLVDSAGSRCDCGAIGCLEAQVTRRDLLEAAGVVAGDPVGLEAALRTRLAAGDTRLTALIDRQIRLLGVALKNIVNLLNPGVIVLGGFLGVLLDVAATALPDRVAALAIRGPREDVMIRRADLGADLLHVGAAELVFRELLRDPAGYVAALRPGGRAVG